MAKGRRGFKFHSSLKGRGPNVNAQVFHIDSEDWHEANKATYAFASTSFSSFYSSSSSFSSSSSSSIYSIRPARLLLCLALPCLALPCLATFKSPYPSIDLSSSRDFSLNFHAPLKRSLGSFFQPFSFCILSLFLFPASPTSEKEKKREKERKGVREGEKEMNGGRRNIVEKKKKKKETRLLRERTSTLFALKSQTFELVSVFFLFQILNIPFVITKGYYEVRRLIAA